MRALYIFTIMFLFVLISCGACGYFTKDNRLNDPIESTLVDSARFKRERYIKMVPNVQDSFGFVGEAGDSLLFSCLSMQGGGLPSLQLDKAEITPGRWGRHPIEPGPDSSVHKSASKFSNDMGLGLLWCFWGLAQGDQSRAKDLITRFIQYNLGHEWDMCGANGAESEGVRLSRCIMKPTLRATTYELAAKLGYNCGTACKTARAVPQVWNPLASGFEAHLAAIHILLRGLIQGGINDLQVDYLSAITRRNPDNALYRAILHLFKDGDQRFASKLLLNAELFPPLELPTNKNYCTEYLWQRDQFEEGDEDRGLSSDWQPCDDKIRTHYADFVFAAWVATTEFSNIKPGGKLDE